MSILRREEGSRGRGKGSSLCEKKVRENREWSCLKWYRKRTERKPQRGEERDPGRGKPLLH